jgi:hypothetical protein
MKTGRTRALALPNGKQWTLQSRAIDQIIIVGLDGAIQYESALPWLPAKLPDGRKVDVVGLRSLQRPVVLDDIAHVHQFVSMRPILVRGPVEDVDDERAGTWYSTLLYLPLSGDQFSYSGPRRAGTDRFDEFLVTVPAIAELAGSNEPTRFSVDQFSILRWVRP